MSGNVVQANVAALFARLRDTVNSELEKFAPGIEAGTRFESDNHWMDDSGSARDSITAYTTNAGDYDKNFSLPNWEQAMTAGFISPVWGNSSDNFLPDIRDADLDADVDSAIILTMFVPYAEVLESGENPNRDNTPSKPPEMKPGERFKPVPGLIEKMSKDMADDFKNVVEGAFQAALV